MEPMNALGILLSIATTLSAVTPSEEAWDRELQRGQLLASQGRYQEARGIFEKERDQAGRFGPANPRLAVALNELGAVYAHLDDLGQAERCYRLAVAIWRALPGVQDVNLIAPLTHLSAIYGARREYSRAEKTALQALDLANAGLGPDHPATAAILASLANLRYTQGDFEGAAARAEQSLAIMRKQPAGIELATALDNLGVIYMAQKRVEKAAPLLTESLDVLASLHQPEHPFWVRLLKDQSAVHVQAGDYRQAEAELSRALALAERVLPPNHPETAAVLRAYAQLLRQTRRKSEAKKLEARAAVIDARSTRQNSIGLTVDVHSLASFR